MKTEYTILMISSNNDSSSSSYPILSMKTATHAAKTAVVISHYSLNATFRKNTVVNAITTL